MNKLYQNKDWLYNQYWNKKQSTRQIANIINCDSTTILRWLKTYNIPRREEGFQKGHLPWSKGKKLSKSIIKKMSDSKRNRKGENATAWKGDNISYIALHQWVRNNKQKTGICIICNKSKKTEWANLNHIQNNGKYERNLDHFFEICLKCHRLYDKCKRNQFNKTYLIIEEFKVSSTK